VHISLIDIVISIALKSVTFHWFWFRECIRAISAKCGYPRFSFRYLCWTATFVSVN